MDIASKKLEFIKEVLQLSNEKIIDKLDDVLKRGKNIIHHIKSQLKTFMVK
jgi:hypothetical protein